MDDSDWKERNSKWRIEMEPVRDKWERLRMFQCGHLSDEHIAERDEQLLAIDVKHGMTNPVTTIETPLELIDDFLGTLKAIEIARENRRSAHEYHEMIKWLENHERELGECENLGYELATSLSKLGMNIEYPDGGRKLEAVWILLNKYTRWANRIKDGIDG